MRVRIIWPWLFKPTYYATSASIEQALQSGITVICDRYAFSGVAFSAVKPSLSYDWCKSPDISLPAPDLVLFLDVSPEVARQRGGYGEERYEKEELQMKVRNVFERIETDTSSVNKNLTWQTIDASGSLEEVHSLITSAAAPLLKGLSTDIARLWI